MSYEDIKGFQFQKGESGNPSGRPPRLINKIEKLPKEAKEMVYARLWDAIRTDNIAGLRQYMDEEGADGECGMILQMAARQLRSKHGWKALNDILDRLFGKPKQTTEIANEGGRAFEIKTVKVPEDLKEKIDGYLNGGRPDGQGV